MAAPLIPLRHFFDNPGRAGGRLSPDGETVSYLAPRDGVLNVWLERAEGGPARPITDDRERGVRSHMWTRDGRGILYPMDRGGDENHHILLVEVGDPRPPRDLTPFAGVRAGLLAAPRATPREIVVAMNLRDRSEFDAYRVTLATGRIELVAQNPGNVLSWLPDREGRVRAARAQSPEGDFELLVAESEGEPFRVIARYPNEDGGHAYAFTPEGDALWVGSAKGADRARLVRVDLATGEETLIDQDEVADLGSPIVSDLTGELLGAAYRRDRLVVHAFDERFARDWDAVRQLHSGDPALAGQDSAESSWLVTFDDDRDPGATYLFRRDSSESRFIFRTRPWLRPEDLAPMRPVTITSRDGLALHSYLTVPVGAPERSLAGVLLVHGGPWARDVWGYDAEAQFLANRGYAVLQVNYRGSTGFGKAFRHAAEREFAGRMHDDLIDVARWATEQGIVDPDRLGIYGGSYGGYAALVGVTFTPDVFAAAVSYVGPSSLVSLMRSFPPYWRPFLASTWHRYVGDPESPDDLADMEARSPLNRVDDIRTPLLVIQGANDPRVTKRESDQIVEALRRRGIDVEYIVKDDEGHGFVKPENRLDAYAAIERFFARHLGGRSEQAI